MPFLHPSAHATMHDVTIDDISRDELQLAARNHGMPLEVLRWPVTPVGMHYLLIHYDIPLVGDDWTLTVDGNVGTPLTLALDELRALPAHEVVATMECAGNGRAKFTPRPLSQPWLDEAIGTGRWRGARLRDVLDRAAPGDARSRGAVHRARPRHRGRRGAGVPAQPAARPRAARTMSSSPTT